MELIERNAVIEFIQEKSWQARQNDDWGGVNSADEIEDFVTKMPTIEEHLKGIKWHKDSDETPNDTKQYLLFREDKSFCIGWYDCSHDGDLLWHEDGGYVIWDVIYWAELPEPYEGSEEDGLHTV